MKMRTCAMAVLGVVLTIGSSANALAHRIVIDDWNGGGSEVVDLTADNMGSFASREWSPGLWPAWLYYWGSRDRAFANLNEGDGIRTQDGSQGYGVNDANSTGHGYWSWTGGQFWVGTVFLSYAADLAGFDIIASFTWDGQVKRQIHLSDLAPGPMTQLKVPKQSYGPYDEVYLEWFSVGGAFAPPGNYDGYVAAGTDLGLAAAGGELRVDDFEIGRVPEPGSLMLFGVGLAGLGLGRRRIAV